MSLKCRTISLVLILFIAASFAVLMWTIVTYKYYNDRSHVRSSICNVSDCTVTVKQCSYDQCNTKSCYVVYYTCYQIDLYLTLDIPNDGHGSYNGKPGTYSDWDSSTHNSMPHCNETTKCYYDTRKIDSSLSEIESRIYYSSRAGVIALGVFGGLFWLFTIGYIIFYIISLRGENICNCDCNLFNRTSKISTARSAYYE